MSNGQFLALIGAIVSPDVGCAHVDMYVRADEPEYSSRLGAVPPFHSCQRPRLGIAPKAAS